MLDTPEDRALFDQLIGHALTGVCANPSLSAAMDLKAVFEGPQAMRKLLGEAVVGYAIVTMQARDRFLASLTPEPRKDETP